MKGLIIRQPHIGKILDGEKTWEMRSRPTKVRGRIALIEAGTGMIVGEAHLTECLEPIREEHWAYTKDFHQLTKDEAWRLNNWSYPWVLENVIEYEKPIPYQHPQGAVIWVNLEWPGMSHFGECDDCEECTVLTKSNFTQMDLCHECYRYEVEGGSDE